MTSTKPLKTYIVCTPVRGTKTFLVKARSASEAKRLVDDDTSNDAVEGLDFNIDWHGKANFVREDQP